MLEDVIRKYNLTEDEIDYHRFDNDAPVEPYRCHVVQKPEVLKECIERCGIIGARIENIMLRYGHIFHLGDIDYVNKKNIKQVLKDKKPLVFGIEVDTPISIVTDKGLFEFEFADSSTVTFNVSDKYESAIQQRLEPWNFDIRKIFQGIIGMKIVDCYVDTEDWAESSFDFTGSHGWSLPVEQGVYIKSFAFKLDNGQYLSFNAFFDFCEVYLLDKDMNIITVPRNTICSMIHNW